MLSLEHDLELLLELGKCLVLLDALRLKLVVLFEDYAKFLFEIDRLLLMLSSVLPDSPLQLCVALLSLFAKKEDLLMELIQLSDVFQSDLVARLGQF